LDYIAPIDIDFTNTNVENEPYNFWDSTKTYAKDNLVINGNYFYRATAENIGKSPLLYNVQNHETEIYWGSPTVVNQYRCLDVLTNGHTTGLKEIYYKFDFGGFDSIAVLQPKAKEVEIKILKEDGTVIDTIIKSLLIDGRVNYPRWRRGNYYYKDATIIDLPFYIDAKYIEVYIRGEEAISVGYIVFGNRKYIGLALTESNVETRAFNSSYLDDYGNVVTKEDTKPLNTIDIDCFIRKAYRQETARNLREIVGKIALFIPTEEEFFNDLVIMAFAEVSNRKILVAGNEELSLELQGFLNAVY
jgi:hypothetical protein